MLHGQRVALPVAVGDGCIHPQAPGKRWGMGGGPAGSSLSTAAGGGQAGGELLAWRWRCRRAVALCGCSEAKNGAFAPSLLS
ncbi:conserved hypothetical protein [Xanthomonas citri pv. citri]|nr:conserved hypothetical protein [Xanthomonas citri pv. citri]